jgi:hypothetical protein
MVGEELMIERKNTRSDRRDCAFVRGGWANIAPRERQAHQIATGARLVGGGEMLDGRIVSADISGSRRKHEAHRPQDQPGQRLLIGARQRLRTFQFANYLISR